MALYILMSIKFIKCKQEPILHLSVKMLQCVFFCYNHLQIKKQKIASQNEAALFSLNFPRDYCIFICKFTPTHSRSDLARNWFSD